MKQLSGDALDTLRVIAMEPDLPAAAQRTMWGLHPKLDATVAARSDLTADVAAHARSHRTAGVRAAYLSGTTHPAELGVTGRTPTEQRAIARNPHAPAGELAKLSGNVELQCYLLRNPGTGDDTLEKIFDQLLDPHDRGINRYIAPGTMPAARCGMIMHAHPHLSELLAAVGNTRTGRVAAETVGVPEAALRIVFDRPRSDAAKIAAAQNPWVAPDVLAGHPTARAARAQLCDSLGVMPDASTAELIAAVEAKASCGEGVTEMLGWGSGAIDRWLAANHPAQTVAAQLPKRRGRFETSPDILAICAEAGGMHAARTVVANTAHTRRQFAANLSRTLTRALETRAVKITVEQTSRATEVLGDDDRAWELAVGLWASDYSGTHDDVIDCAAALAS